MSRAFSLIACACLSFLVATVVHAGSTWSHNESTVFVDESGSDVSIIYRQPSNLMRRNGVKSGTVLFTGRRDGNFLYGTAHRFTARCPGTYDYNVAGQWYGDDRLILWGLAQRRGKGCVLEEPFTEQLVFTLVSRSPQVDDTVKPKNLLDEKNSNIAETVLGCYREGAYAGGTITIRQMRNCAGVWVTPKVLLQCAMGAYCAVLDDTLADRKTLEAVLAEENLDFDKPLVFPSDASALPPLPDRAAIDSCKESSQDEKSFEECVIRKSNNGRYDALLTCMMGADDAKRTKCLMETANNGNFTYLAGCAKGRAPTAADLVECIPNQDVKAKLTEMTNCISSASSTEDQIACLSIGIPTGDAEALNCSSENKSPAEMIGCLTKGSPQASAANTVVSCLMDEDHSPLECASGAMSGPGKSFLECFTLERAAKASCITKENAKFGGDIAGRAVCVTQANSDLELAQCIGDDAGADFARLTSCALEKDKAKAAICLLGDSKEAKAVQKYYQCASEGTEFADLLANCTEGLLDGKSSQALSCVVRANGDAGLLTGCAAGAALPPEAAKLVGCAATSQGATDFVLCSAGPAMNEEWRIAAECAVNSGGVPITFAACTAGRLTVRELTKCFKGDCFGPNNTIVVGIRNAVNDLTQGPGKNNEVVKAVDAIGDLAGGDNSVINNPGQIFGGSNSMFRNPGQIWGGDNSVFNQAVGGKNSEVRKFLRHFDVSTW